ncbi:MAG: RluA family pseudouridine synthase [Bacteroidota bacterium]|nr:RluA family pseudouridine synthase [Bacteroidota bacterium]
MEENKQNFDTEELYEHHRIVVDAGQDSLRIDKFLMNRIMNVSRNRIQNAAKANCVLVNSNAVKSNYKIKPDDVISIVLPEPPQNKEVIAEDIPIDIKYEDNDIIIVNKQPGMVVHPAYGNFTGTLVNALLYHVKDLPSSDDNDVRAGLVHRIDKDTSGLLVIAKNDDTLTKLAKQFFDHSIERKYIALVWGNVEEDGRIEKNLIRNPKDRRRMKALKNSDRGRTAITYYKVLERFAYTTLIECRLETGRTHQIRVHMSSIGHPVFNDVTYGGNKVISGPSFIKYKQFVNNCFKIIPRQALHAKSLGFIHPATNEKVFFDSQLPEDMEKVIEKWRGYSKVSD